MELAQEGAPIAVTTILPASIDTPFLEHARSKLGDGEAAAAVYAPEIVAASIVYAAGHPGGRRAAPAGSGSAP